MLAGMGVVVAVLVALAVIVWVAARPADPDAFGDPPDEFSDEPGALIRDEAWTKGVPEGAEAWRLLHTTTRADGSPAVVTTLVLAPKARPEGEPLPVIAWAHGTTGVARGCAPSLLDAPFGGIPALDEVIANGWALVATDYVGLGTPGDHAYLEGDTAARNVLDSVRAARQLDGLELANTTQVWGHSQGGNTTLFAAEIAPDYAPDVEVVGAAAIAPATLLEDLLAEAEGTTVGTILTSLTLVSWSRVYDDVDLDEVVRPGARTLVRDIAGRCVVAPEALPSLAEAAVLRGDVLAVDPSTPPLAAHMAANSPDGRLAVPTIVGQGLADSVVAPGVTDAYVEQRCADGDAVTYHRYPGIDHLPIVLDGSPFDPVLLDWTVARFAGDPPPTACETTTAPPG